MTALSPVAKTARAARDPQVHRWRAFAVLAVAYFMTIVDLTIVNVALPTIGRELHFSETNLQWVVTAYGLTFGGFLLLGGRAADLLGRRRILMLGLGIFTAASLACALATTDGFLIAMRGLQGLGAAIVLPAALSIVMNMFDEGAERNKALGLWGGIGASGATVGLIAGGLSPATSAGSTSSSSMSRSARSRSCSHPASCRKAGSIRRAAATTRSAASRSPAASSCTCMPSRRRRSTAGPAD
jgi:MFS family permease